MAQRPNALTRCAAPRGRPAKRLAAFLVGPALFVFAALDRPATAQEEGPPIASAPAKPFKLRKIEIAGNKRISSQTVRAASGLRKGQTVTNELLDNAIRNLFETGEFADVTLTIEAPETVVVQVREAPIIRAVIYEGNVALSVERMSAYTHVAPGLRFTRSGVRAQVAVIIELYRRLGRYSASVEPKMVSLENNEVDLIFEIKESSGSYIRRIDIIGNEHISDAEIRGIFESKVAMLRHVERGAARYDQDAIARDQQRLADYYRARGFPRFRVISAIAELTPDKRDFILTYVVEEGPLQP